MSKDEISAELHRIAKVPAPDPFNFSVLKVETRREPDTEGYNTTSMKISLIARIGVTEFETFTIDATNHRHTQEPIEVVSVSPLLGTIIDDEDILPTFDIYATAIESHLADKICAMYEPHPSGASNRYHDLADIITIIQTQDFSAAKLSQTLSHESARRGIVLPRELTAPSRSWQSHYEKHASSFTSLPADLRSLEASLSFADNCINPILEGTITAKHWNHVDRNWQ